MSKVEETVAAHYAGAGMHDKIMQRLADAGIPAEAVTAEHLRPVDEFHIGEAAATAALLDQLTIGPATRVLDIGSGIGGPARTMARTYGARVTGIDLTPDYVDTARKLTALLGGEVEFVLGSALDMPFEAGSFDLATLLHVGMNLPDKPRLFAEVARVLAPGGQLLFVEHVRAGHGRLVRWQERLHEPWRRFAWASCRCS